MNTLNPKMSRDEIIVGQRLAPEQLQLDIYGELMDAVCLYDKYGTPRRQYRPPPKRNGATRVSAFQLRFTGITRVWPG